MVFLPQKSAELALNSIVSKINDLYDRNNFGFVVSLDISGAFDAARYDIILGSLRRFSVPPNIYAIIVDYFCDRLVELPLMDHTSSKIATGGTPQGGKISPLLWNVLLDDLLKLSLPTGCFLQAYADDCLLICEHRDIEICATLTNNVLAMISDWGTYNDLVFNPVKTKCMLVTKRRKFNLPQIIMNGHLLSLVSSMKILGLVIDSKLTWNGHIDFVESKALKIYNFIKRKFGSRWGLSYDVLRTVYLQAIEPMILYACPVWRSVLCNVTKRNRLLSLQRRFAIGMIRAYRTVSLEASLVIANIVPIDLKIQYWSEVFDAKNYPSLMFGSYQLPLNYADTIHPALITSFDVHGIDDGNMEFCCASHNYYIFTDGSKIDGLVGASFVAFYRNDCRPVAVQSFRLADQCTVFQAEILAIKKAFEWIVANNIVDVQIISDSKSAIQSICKIYSYNRIVQEIFRTIAGYCNHLCLAWTRSHSGNYGNDLADFYAKKATLLPIIDYDQPSFTNVYRNFQSNMYGNWQQSWDVAMNGRITKMFFPTIQSRLKSKLQPNFVVTQFVSNHGKFGEYLSRFGQNNSSCSFCLSSMQSSLHLLLECPAFNLERSRFMINAKFNNVDVSAWLQDEALPLFLVYINFIYSSLIMQ